VAENYRARRIPLRRELTEQYNITVLLLYNYDYLHNCVHAVTSNNSVGLDHHRLCAHLTLSIASLHSSVKPGIDLAHIATVGIVSSIAFWIAVVMSLITWSRSFLDLMCWPLGSPSWSAPVNIFCTSFVRLLVVLLSDIPDLLQLGDDLMHNQARR
jgi:hypothetical protein